MKPYYQDDWATIYHGDAREILGRLPLADLAIVDPPYGTTSLDWDRPIAGLFGALDDSIKPNGSAWMFGQFRSLAAAWHEVEATGWRYAQDLVWEKHNGSSFHADRFRRVHELIVQAYRTSERWADVYKDPQFTNDATKRTVRRKERPAHMGVIADSAYVSHDGGPRLMRSVVLARSCHGSADHPTQKPTALLSRLICYSCPEGGLVLDPTAGSGSTLVASTASSRKSIGIEIEERYCEIAAKRLAQGVLWEAVGA